MQRVVTSPITSAPVSERPLAPPEHVLLSSHHDGWDSLVLEQHIRPAAAHAVPALNEHTLLLVLGQPVRMVQQRDGRHDNQLVGASDLLLTPAGMETTCRWDGTLNMVHLRIPQLLLTHVAIEANMAHPEHLELINQFCVRDPQLEQLVLALRSEVEAQDIGGRLAVESLSNLLAIQLLRNYSNLTWRESRPSEPVPALSVRRVTDYINDNLHADLALAELAAIALLSPYHFARTFKRAIGFSPHQYVLRQRVMRAKELLISTNQTVGEIALAVGFYDQGHLARHMRRLLGITPQLLKNRTKLR